MFTFNGMQVVQQMDQQDMGHGKMDFHGFVCDTSKHNNILSFHRNKEK